MSYQDETLIEDLLVEIEKARALLKEFVESARGENAIFALRSLLVKVEKYLEEKISEAPLR